MLQVAVGALFVILSVVLALNSTWVQLLGRFVDIPDEEYPRWLRGSCLFPLRYRIFQLNLAAVTFITGLAFVVTGLGV